MVTQKSHNFLRLSFFSPACGLQQFFEKVVKMAVFRLPTSAFVVVELVASLFLTMKAQQFFKGKSTWK